MNDTNPALAPGIRLENYIIGRKLGGGGFSIVYLAKDVDSGEQVAIKEYMPRKLAYRSEDGCTVHSIDDNTAESFAIGRRLFFQEASTLASIKHPHIINVHNFIRAHGTIYMVMEYVRGINLQDYIRRHKGGLSETFIYHVFLPLLEGLKMIHERGLLHMDIKPANIHLRPGGSPVLLDFGAVHEMQQSRQYQPSQVLTLGFSPVEQSMAGGYVGPWTDIYAIGATIRACIEGASPPPAEARQKKDTMKAAVEAFRKNYPKKLLTIIDWTMEIDPMCRPQSVDQLIEALNDSKADMNTADNESMFDRLANSFSWMKGGSR